MKKIYMITALVGVLSLLAVQVYSHGRGGGYGYGDCYGNGFGYGNSQGGQYMQKELQLTDEQVKAIDKINAEYREKFYQNRGNPEKMHALQDQRLQAIEKLLTKEQKEKFATLRTPEREDGRYSGYRMGYRGHGYGHYRSNRGCW